MIPLRVLIVDDSVVVRKALSRLVGDDAELEVAGTAPSAVIGLQKISQCNPDIVMVDVEMEGMNGIEMVGEIRKQWPRLPVLMCSTLTERGASATLAALAAGASDYITKPSKVGAEDPLEAFRVDLVARLKLLGRRTAPAAAPVAPPPVAPRYTPSDRPPSVVLIGCSTGGPNALTRIFSALTAPPPVPVLVVQHMPPLFTRMLAERLTKESPLPTEEARSGQVIRPGHAYVAPGDFHMTVVRRGTDLVTELDQGPPECSCRPAIDPLFRSAATVYGRDILALVLTGMGHDGTRGARQVIEVGGRVVVQDAASCVVPSMPSSVLEAGLPATVVPLDDMANFLERTMTPPRRWRS